MALHTTTDVDEIAALLDNVLAVDALRNTVFGSVLRGLDAPDAAPWAAHPVGRPLILAARSQVATSVGVTAGWSGSASAALGRHLVALNPPAAAVMGPAESVTSVPAPAAVLGRRDERLFRLAQLQPPSGVSGRARPAAEADRDILTDWFGAFRAESLGGVPAGYNAAAEDAQRWRTVRMWLWESGYGAPASMAFAQPTVHGVARIGPVYTPPQLRGRGFGSAATAAATADILARPAVPCLFTDRANPTSNKIYRALGYEEVADFTELRFT